MEYRAELASKGIVVPPDMMQPEKPARTLLNSRIAIAQAGAVCGVRGKQRQPEDAEGDKAWSHQGTRRLRAEVEGRGGSLPGDSY